MREPKERSGYDKTKSVVVEETETTRLFRNADGTLTAQLSSGPARLADEDGTWQDIDLTLRRVGDRFEPIASPTPVSFATESGDGPIAEVRLGTDSLRLAPSELVSDIEGTKRSEGALPVIAYSGALPGGISLAIAPTTVGVETIYTVPDSSAALAPLVERYEMREGWTARQNGTAIELLDASGSVRAIWAGGFATDSADQPAETDVTVQLLPDANGAASATVVVAPEWLNDPRRVYPIKIDPSITTVRNAGEPGMGDSWIRDRQPNTNGWSSGELRLGNDGSDFLGDPPSSVYRTLLKFRTDLPADAVVESATVKLYETMAWSCEPTPFNSVRAFSPWGPGTTWESQPAADAPENGGAALAAKGLAGCPAGWVDITGPEVEAYVQGWNNALHGKPGGFANNGLLLLADNETDADAQYGWKKFASSEAGKPPELWITYSRPPTGPAPRIPAHGAVINSPRPVLTVFPATSPTNGAVDYWFEVATGADMSGNTVASSGWQSPTSYTVPDGALQDGVTYYWRATARADGLETDGPVRSFRHDRRFGTGGPSPQDPVGPVSVNLATGNLALGVSSPKFPTVGGEVGLDFSYNSLAPDKAGLRGTYFDVANQPTPNLDNADDLLQRVDSTVAFDWASGSPQSGVVPSDNFGVRWTGYLTTPSNVPSGQYFFGAYHDDGIVITVDGTKVVDLWAPNGGTLHYGSPVTLGPGETVPVQIDFYEAGAGAAVNFYVKGAVNEQPVPASWLSTEPPTLPRGWSMSADLDGSVSYGSARYANDRIVLVGPGGETHRVHREGWWLGAAAGRGRHRHAKRHNQTDDGSRRGRQHLHLRQPRRARVRGIRLRRPQTGGTEVHAERPGTSAHQDHRPRHRPRRGDAELWNRRLPVTAGRHGARSAASRGDAVPAVVLGRHRDQDLLPVGSACPHRRSRRRGHRLRLWNARHARPSAGSRRRGLGGGQLRSAGHRLRQDDRRVQQHRHQSRHRGEVAGPVRPGRHGRAAAGSQLQVHRRLRRAGRHRRRFPGGDCAGQRGLRRLRSDQRCAHRR